MSSAIRTCLMDDCDNQILGRPNKIFCSDTCSARERAKRLRERIAENRMARLEAAGCLDIHCAECRKEFRPDWKEFGPKKYCSVACRDTARNRKLRANRASRAGKKKAQAPRQPVIHLDDTPPPPLVAEATKRLCANCTNWTGSRGCALEAFRACNPGVMSRYWQGAQQGETA